MPKYKRVSPKAAAKMIIREAKKAGVRSHADLSEFLMDLDISDHPQWLDVRDAIRDEVAKGALKRSNR